MIILPKTLPNISIMIYQMEEDSRLPRPEGNILVTFRIRIFVDYTQLTVGGPT